MSKRVLFLNSCFISRRKDKIEHTYPHLRIGISSIAGYLQSRRVAVSVLDPYLNNTSLGDLVTQILAAKPDYLGLQSYTEEIVDACRIASAVKEKAPEIRVVLGGYHVSALPVETLSEFPVIDIGVVGQGERTMGDIVSGTPLPAISGIVYRDSAGQVVLTSRRSNVIALEDLPLPAWELFDVKRYDSEYFPIEPLRACPFNCAFCFRASGRKVYYKSPEKFIGELRHYTESLGIKRFWFQAGSFPVRRSHAVAICEGILASGLKVIWTAATRVDLIDQEMIALMRRAGCESLRLGIESGDVEILNFSSKGITPELSMRVLEMCRKVGMKTMCNFILGLPFETQDSLMATYRMALEVLKHSDEVNFGILVPYPGTKVYEMAQKGEGGIHLRTHNWSDFGKQVGLSLQHDNFLEGELQKYQSRFYLGCYLRHPFKALQFYSFGRAMQVLRRAFGWRD